MVNYRFINCYHCKKDFYNYIFKCNYCFICNSNNNNHSNIICSACYDELFSYNSYKEMFDFHTKLLLN